MTFSWDSWWTKLDCYSFRAILLQFPLALQSATVWPLDGSVTQCCLPFEILHRHTRSHARLGVIKKVVGLSGKREMMINVLSSFSSTSFPFSLSGSFPSLLSLIFTSLTSSCLSGDIPSHLTLSVIGAPCFPSVPYSSVRLFHPPLHLRLAPSLSLSLLKLKSLLSAIKVGATRNGTKGQSFIRWRGGERVWLPLGKESSQQLAAGDEIRFDLPFSPLVFMAAPPIVSFCKLIESIRSQ